jgi:hypothetical protein
VVTISAVALTPGGATGLPGLESLLRQEGSDLEILVVARESETLPPVSDRARVVRVGGAPSPAAFRNAAVRAASGKYVCLLEPGERLEAPRALADHVALLDRESAPAASYGRTLVEERGAARAYPERGRGGRVLRPLVQYKSYIVSLASVVWRRDLLLKEGFSESYRTSQGLLLSLLIELARDRSFAFSATSTAVAAPVRDDLAALEEKVKIFVALLYGATRLDERIEVRVRFRLARHLVALGKHHYRQGDHGRAGRLFSEAVKATPSYFKGRRYQFMNFLKGVMAR